MLLSLEFLILNKSRNRTQAVATTHRTDVTIAKNASQKPKHVAFHPWENAQAWVESITKEESRRKQWEQMYGWMGDFDFKVITISINISYKSIYIYLTN